MIENKIHIPKGWDSATLSEITSKLVDGSHNPPPKQDDGFPMLSAINISNNKINFSSYRLITKSSFELEDCRTRIKAGDVLLTIVGAIGRTAVVPDRIKPFTLQRSVAVLTPILVDPKFLMYQLESPDLSNFFMRNAKGTAQKGIYLNALGATEILLPPLNEQKRIVAKIEELFSELDKGIENLKTAREQLKVYRQAILKHAFEQTGGKKTTLGELLSYITSGSRGWAEYYSDSGELFIRAQNLKYDRLDLTECAYVSIPNKTEGTRTRVQQGDLLITITGANVTKSALIDQNLGTAYVSQHVALCRPIKEVLPKFLYWFVIAEAAGRKQLSSAAYGAGKPGLNLDNIKSVQVTIPSYEQQVTAVQIIEEKLSVCEELEQEIERNIQKSEALRQSILKKAFSGKLVAQDPDDEPASVLLERIRAKKEEQKPESKKSKAKRNAA